MKRIFQAMLCFLMLLAAAVPAAAAERGVLYRLSLGTHVMHLFGTLHVGAPEFYPLEPRLMAALARSSTLVLETDPAPPRAELLRALQERGTLAPGDGSYDGLDPALRQRLDALVRAGGLDATGALGYKPTLLAALLALAEYTKQGYRIDLSGDAWLARQARAAGVQVLGLDTLDGQLALLDRLAPPDRWRFLDETVATIESGAQRSNARELVRAWSTADRQGLDAIAARCTGDASVSGRFAVDVLIRGRNAGIADRLEHLLEDEDRTVAAIGVLHLLGEGSVPALLTEHGINVERLY